MLKRVKSILSLMLVMLTIFSFSTTAFAADVSYEEKQAIFDVQVSPTVSFVLYQNETSTQQTRAKSYTSDSYTGYFYLTATGQKISDHTFTAYFSYSGDLVTCYNTDTTVIMDRNYTGNLRPEVENEGRSTVTPTLAYGYVTFVLYNANDSVNTEVTIHIYCNQDGTTWVERQG